MFSFSFWDIFLFFFGRCKALCDFFSPDACSLLSQHRSFPIAASICVAEEDMGINGTVFRKEQKGAALSAMLHCPI